MSDDNDSSIRIVLLGETGGGKTNLINNYFDLAFNSNKASTISAESMDGIVEIDNRKFSICIWDTAGQEKYRSITKIFIKGAKIVIFVYDITEELSFTNLGFWVDSVEELLGKDPILGLVGNKIDLFNNQTVKTEQGKEYAKKIGAKFCETSAKEDKATFKKFVNELVENYVQGKGMFNDEININLKKKNKKEECFC